MPRSASPDPDSFDHVEVWIFDLDNTLYPRRCNLFDQIDRRMGEFIAGYMGVDFDEARRLQKDHFRQHGTTLRGLMVEQDMDPGAFLDYVHEIDLSGIPADVALDAALDRLPGRKLIFTNGTRDHAARVTDRLGIRHHFEDVFDIVDSDYLPKPTMDPYEKMLARHGIDPQKAIMFEDMDRNLAPAAALGMTTVWVSDAPDSPARAADTDHVHHHTDDLTTWLTALP